MYDAGESVRVPVLPGRKVWVVNRGEVFPMRVSEVSIRETGVFITIVYDGDDPRNERWNITCLTERDIGRLFFLSQKDAEASRDSQ